MTQSAVIYSRVSTNKQDADNQIKVLEGWAKERGLEGPSRRCETGTSARRKGQEAPQKTIAEIALVFQHGT